MIKGRTSHLSIAQDCVSPSAEFVLVMIVPDEGGHHRPSAALSGPQRPSAALSGHQRSAAVISGHQRPSAALSGKQRLTIHLIGDEYVATRSDRLDRRNGRDRPIDPFELDMVHPCRRRTLLVIR